MVGWVTLPFFSFYFLKASVPIQMYFHVHVHEATSAVATSAIATVQVST